MVTLDIPFPAVVAVAVVIAVAAAVIAVLAVAVLAVGPLRAFRARLLRGRLLGAFALFRRFPPGVPGRTSFPAAVVVRIFRGGGVGALLDQQFPHAIFGVRAFSAPERGFHRSRRSSGSDHRNRSYLFYLA